MVVLGVLQRTLQTWGMIGHTLVVRSRWRGVGVQKGVVGRGFVSVWMGGIL